MKRASFFGIEFLSGVAVGAGCVAGALGIIKLQAACKREMTTGPQTVETLETLETSDSDAAHSAVPEKKARAARRPKSGASTPRKSSEHEPHRAKSWKN